MFLFPNVFSTFVSFLFLISKLISIGCISEEKPLIDKNDEKSYQENDSAKTQSKQRPNFLDMNSKRQRVTLNFAEIISYYETESEKNEE
ncbi:hypothetical protein CWI37_0004p0050 [Hamiltosporidium tvaerminnensis]|uniref:Lipoprotein n=1 Tax=Hamiltosporidium tvaerminnensis TaxID=1176355 RepID=A0A4V2JVU9_9MICR|nr:hypothetical protein CWI37_1608p0010 [Hamiltosporidium tvaerminnensis]TBU05522.1 hypothetical protein CWI37_0004p0050 [Hamiltosporidium tvaerminnensis]